MQGASQDERGYAGYDSSGQQPLDFSRSEQSHAVLPQSYVQTPVPARQMDYDTSIGSNAPAPNLGQQSAANPGGYSTSGLDLGFLRTASSSHNSLLEAVVGPGHSQYSQTVSAKTAAPVSMNTGPSAKRPSGASNQSDSRVPSGSEAATSFGTSTEESWDVLSDASLKINEGGMDEQQVAELEKKINKRKSNLPHLETELAALDARIKEAEARLAKAQAGGQAVAGGSS